MNKGASEMRETKDCCKAYFDGGGIHEISYEGLYEIAEAFGGTVAEQEATEPELSAHNSLFSPSADYLVQPHQATDESILFTFDDTEELPDNESWSSNEGSCLLDDKENGSLEYQTDQPSFISDAFPELIWEPFNPVQQIPDRGTIDPRSHPVPFEELLKSLAPRKFSLKSSFSIHMAITRGSRLKYRTVESNRGERARMRPQQTEQQQSVAIQPHTQLDAHGTSDSYAEALDPDYQNFASREVDLAGPNENSNNAFQQPYFSGGPQPYQRTQEDMFEASDLYANDASSSPGSLAREDQDSEYEDSVAKKRKRVAQVETTTANNKKQKCAAKAHQKVPKEALNPYAKDASMSPGSLAGENQESEYEDSAAKKSTKVAKVETTTANNREQKRAAEAHQKVPKKVSEQKTPDGKWKDHEIDATGRKLQEIRSEDQNRKKPITIDNLYMECSHRLKSEGIEKSASSIRSFWNRSGRSHPIYGFDERANPNPNRLAVGLQENRSKKGKARIAERKAKEAAKQSSDRVQAALQSIEGTREEGSVSLKNTEVTKEEQRSEQCVIEQSVTEQRLIEQPPAGYEFTQQNGLEERYLRQQWQDSSNQRSVIQSPPPPRPRMDSEELREARERCPSSELEDYDGEGDDYHPLGTRKHRRKT